MVDGRARAIWSAAFSRRAAAVWNAWSPDVLTAFMPMIMRTPRADCTPI